MSATKIAVHKADSLPDAELGPKELGERRLQKRAGRRGQAKSRRTSTARRPCRASIATTAEGPMPLDVPSADSEKQVEKLKHFLVTLQHLAGDVSPYICDYVRSLVVELLDDLITPEQFHRQLTETVNFPLKPFVVPFLKSTLPALRAELGRRQSLTRPLTPTEKWNIFAAGGGSTPPAMFSPPLRSSEAPPMQEARLATPSPRTTGSSFRPDSLRVHPYAKRAAPLPSKAYSAIVEDGGEWKAENPTFSTVREIESAFSAGELFACTRRRGSDCSDLLTSSGRQPVIDAGDFGLPRSAPTAVEPHFRTSDRTASPLRPNLPRAQHEWQWPPDKVALVYAAMHDWEDISARQSQSAYGEAGRLPETQSFLEQWLSINEMVNCMHMMVEGVQQLVAILRHRSARRGGAVRSHLDSLKRLNSHPADLGTGTYGTDKRVGDFLRHDLLDSSAAELLQRASDSMRENGRADSRTGCNGSDDDRLATRLTNRSCTPMRLQQAGWEKQAVSAQRPVDDSSSTLLEACEDIGRSGQLLLPHNRKDSNSRRPRGSCWRCGRRTDKMCSNCCTARYCSALCQRKDWPRHSLTCLTTTTESQGKGLTANH